MSLVDTDFQGHWIKKISPGHWLYTCHDSVNSKGLFIVRTRLPPRVYSLSPKSSEYIDVDPPSGVTV